MAVRDRENHRAWRRRRVEQLLAIVAEAKDKPCADCGVSYPKQVMDFDHRPDTPRNGAHPISYMVHQTPSDERLRAEIAKCDVVCANCHRLRHAP